MSDEMPDEDDELLKVEEVAPGGRQAHQVYAKFGVAMYGAQTLEFVILAVLEWSGLVSGRYTTAEAWARADAELLRKTLGALQKALIVERVDLTHLEEDLVRAVALRNFLAHNYFRERIDAIESWEGRERMVAELDQAHDLFNALVQRLRPITRGIVDEFSAHHPLPQVDTRTRAGEFDSPVPGLS
jgi:hypothetical protein